MEPEIKPDVPEVAPEVPDTKPEVVEYTPIEKRAMEMGWRPKSEFQGDEDTFVDAKEFVGRAPLFEKIEHQNKQLKEINKVLSALKTHYTAREQAAVTRALNELKAARKEAITNSDGDAFDRIDTEIRRVESQVAEIDELQRNAPAEPEQRPEFVSWSKRNTWYETDADMRAFADSYGTAMAKKPGADPEAVLKNVEIAVRKAFPEKFRNPNKDDAPDIDSGSSAPRGAAREVKFTLTDQEAKIMKTLVSAGEMTEKEYLSQLKAIKGVR